MAKRQSGGPSKRIPRSSLDDVANKQSRAKGPGASSKELKRFLHGGKSGYGVSKDNDIPIAPLSGIKF